MAPAWRVGDKHISLRLADWLSAQVPSQENLGLDLKKPLEMPWNLAFCARKACGRDPLWWRCIWDLGLFSYLKEQV